VGKKDISLLIGIGTAFGALVIAFMMEGGSPLKLIGLSALVIIIGGTFGALTVSFGLGTVMTLPAGVIRTLNAPMHDHTHMVNLFVTFAEKARKEGLLSLEEEIQSELGNKEYDQLLKRGLSLVVDGIDASAIQQVFEVEISEYEEREKSRILLFEQAGGFSPTMGIIGTVLGLISVLGHLAEPEKLGESIAAAFIATLYGIGFANIIWLPIANKLKIILKAELELKNLILIGVISLQAGDNPRILKDKLVGFIPENRRDKVTSTD
jgi:chemotaxis protein MotA